MYRLLSYTPDGATTFFSNVTFNVTVNVSGAGSVGITEIYTNEALSNTLTNTNSALDKYRLCGYQYVCRLCNEYKQ